MAGALRCVEGMVNVRSDRLAALRLRAPLPSGAVYAGRGRAYMLGLAYDGAR